MFTESSTLRLLKGPHLRIQVTQKSVSAADDLDAAKAAGKSDIESAVEGVGISLWPL